MHIAVVALGAFGHVNPTLSFVTELIKRGNPMIAIPQMEEQAITARQIEEKGLGIAFLDKNRITGAALKAAIQDLLGNPAYKQTAEEYSADMKSLGGSAASAEALLKFLQNR